LKGDNVVVRSADFYFSNIIISNYPLTLYLYSNGKKGKQANNERDRERESASVGALRRRILASAIKLTVGKNPLTSFWEKLERLSFSCETILMEKWNRKDT
jgi:hypothetical protein